MASYSLTEIEKLPPGSVALVFSEPETMPELTADVVRTLTAQADVIYFSITKTVDHQTDMFRKAGINVDNIRFIDCLSKTTGTETKTVKNAVIVHPSNLIGMARTLTGLLSKTKGKKVVFFDPVTTLLIYNSLPALAKFVTTIVSRIRESGASAVFLCLASEKTEELTQELEKTADKIIRA